MLAKVNGELNIFKSTLDTFLGKLAPIESSAARMGKLIADAVILSSHLSWLKMFLHSSPRSSGLLPEQVSLGNHWYYPATWYHQVVSDKWLWPWEGHYQYVFVWNFLQFVSHFGVMSGCLNRLYTHNYDGPNIRNLSSPRLHVGPVLVPTC